MELGGQGRTILDGRVRELDVHLTEMLGLVVRRRPGLRLVVTDVVLRRATRSAEARER
jgi:hypothetical protein